MHESRWCVLYVITNHEKRVAQHLTARSLEHYLPLYTERSRWTDRVVSLERPLFAGYVFVRFAPEARRFRYQHSRGTPSARRDGARYGK